MNLTAFLIGLPGTDHVSIRPTARERPGTDEYWDANWLEAEVAVQAGAFRGSYKAQIRTDELAELQRGLEQIQGNLGGDAAFHSMEEWLSFRLTGDGRGLFQVTGYAKDAPGTGNRLTFDFEIDQTFLGPMQRDLDTILREFPVSNASSSCSPHAAATPTSPASGSVAFRNKSSEWPIV